MPKEDKVIQFLDGMKEVFPQEIKFVFYRGYCYWLAYILAGRFNGEIWFNPRIVHFAARINGKLYDIYGKIEPGISPIDGQENHSENQWCNWSLYQEYYQENIPNIVDSCIKKHKRCL